MKFLKLILTFFLISSCATTVVDQRKVIPELFDPELKKGKIFIFSNHVDIRTINIRVNDEVRKMKHTETQIFDFKSQSSAAAASSRRGCLSSRRIDPNPFFVSPQSAPGSQSFEDIRTHKN